VVLTIVIASVLLMLTASVVFLFARYAPIIANLFMNITTRRVQNGELPLTGEDVTFETTDGVRLAGTLGRVPATGTDVPVVVFCHEFMSGRHTVTKYASFLEAGGFRVFTFDFRGHGDSECPLGYVPRQWVTKHEVSDLRAALRYLRDREDVGDAAVGLLGLSRGAVAAIAVAGDDPTVSGVVADGAFSTDHTLHSYMRRWAPIFVDRRMLPFSRFEWILGTFRRVGIRLAEHRLGVRFVSVLPALRRLSVPVFFIHGQEDSYVEPDQAKLLSDLVDGRKALWIVPHADHNKAFDVAPVEYGRRVVRFFQTSLPFDKAQGPEPVEGGMTAPAVTTPQDSEDPSGFRGAVSRSTPS